MHEVRSPLSSLTCFSNSFLFMHRLNHAQIALSDKFNSNSAIVTSTSLEGRTKISLEDAAQTRFGLLWHQVPPLAFNLAHNIHRGILQLVVGSIRSLFMLMACDSYFRVQILVSRDN
jgi:hypothetical protein